MKNKYALLITLLFGGSVVFAQNDGTDDDFENSSGDIVTESGFTGNVGIGVASPIEKLDVDGNIQIEGILKLTEDGTYTGEIKAVNPGSGSDDIEINAGSGKLKLNTSGISNRLQIMDNDASSGWTNIFGNIIAHYDVSLSGYDYWFDGSTGKSYIERGDFALGHNNPTERLDVDGNIKASGNGSFDVAGVGSPVATRAMFYHTGVTDPTTDYALLQDVNGSTILNSKASADLKLFVGGAEGIRIKSSTLRVGIGNNSPDEKLDVTGNINTTGEYKSTDNLKLRAGTGKYVDLYPSHSSYGLVLRSPNASEYTYFTTDNSANLLIGRNSSTEYNIKLTNSGYLDLHSTNSTYGTVIRSEDASKYTNLLTNNDGDFFVGDITAPYLYAESSSSGNTAGYIGIGTTTPTEKLDVAGTVNATGLTIPTGTVNIGNASSVPTGYLMVVNGRMGAKELKVEVNGSWGDYVFEDDYKLLPLNELQEFITENKHLPNVPSASELEKDGINTSEMLNNQMVKIEELTLHLIKMNERLEKVELENQSLKEQISNK